MPFKAFISYSHAADNKLAPTLQSALHRFAKPWYRLRSMRVFRDKTTLAMTEVIWPAIERALQQSEYFLLMAAPEAARSPWVQKEVGWWLENRPSKSLLIVLTSGEVKWSNDAHDFDWTTTTALPALLTHRYADEPGYVDLRWAKDVDNLSLRHLQFRAAVLDIAATLLHKDKDALDGDDVRQHRRTTAVASTAVAAIAAFAAVATWQAYVAQQRYKVALSRQLAAEAINQVDNQPDRALLLAAASLRTRDTVEARSSLLYALEASPFLEYFLDPGAEGAQSVAFDREGNVASGHENGEILVWSAHDFARPVARLQTSAAPIRAVAFSPDGRAIASGNSMGEITVWDRASGRAVRSVREHGGGVNGLAFSPDGNWLASAGEDWRVLFAPLNDSEEAKSIDLDGVPTSVDVDRTGSIVAVGDEAGNVAFWRPDSGDLPVVVPTSNDSESRGITSVAFDPAGAFLASASKSGSIVLWDVRAPAHPVAIRSHATGPEALRAVAISPDGRMLAAVGDARSVTLWDTATLDQIAAMKGHTEIVWSVAFSKDGRALASSDKGGRIVVWDLAAREPLYEHADEVWAVDVSPDGRLIATSSADHTIVVSNVAARTHQTLSAHREGVSSIAFLNHDGSRLASAGLDFIAGWQLGPKLASRVIAEGGSDTQLASAPGPGILLSGSREGQIKRWDITGNAASAFGSVRESGIDKLAVSVDGRLAASVDEDGNVLLWDVPTGAVSHEFPRLGTKGWSIAFDDRGETLATGHKDGRILLWDLRSPDKRGVSLGSHLVGIKSLAFSHDGEWLASGGSDGGIRLWDVVSRRQVGPELHRHSSIVTGLAFEPASPATWLVSTSDDHKVLLWPMSITSWQRRACERANRDLSPEERTRYLGSNSLAPCAR